MPDPADTAAGDTTYSGNWGSTTDAGTSTSGGSYFSDITSPTTNYTSTVDAGGVDTGGWSPFSGGSGYADGTTPSFSGDSTPTYSGYDGGGTWNSNGWSGAGPASYTGGDFNTTANNGYAGLDSLTGGVASGVGAPDPSGGWSQFNLRGPTDLYGAPKTPATGYTINYQTAQILRGLYENLAKRYTDPELAQGLNKLAGALPGEAHMKKYGIAGTMQPLARVGLNQMVRNISMQKMLEGMDTTGSRDATVGLDKPGPKSFGMTPEGNPLHTLASIAIQDAARFQGIPNAAVVNANNFVATGTPPVPGTVYSGYSDAGSSYYNDPTGQKAITQRNSVAQSILNKINAEMSGGVADVVKSAPTTWNGPLVANGGVQPAGYDGAYDYGVPYQDGSDSIPSPNPGGIAGLIQSGINAATPVVKQYADRAYKDIQDNKLEIAIKTLFGMGPGTGGQVGPGGESQMPGSDVANKEKEEVSRKRDRLFISDAEWKRRMGLI